MKMPHALRQGGMFRIYTGELLVVLSEDPWLRAQNRILAQESTGNSSCSAVRSNSRDNTSSGSSGIE